MTRIGNTDYGSAYRRNPTGQDTYKKEIKTPSEEDEGAIKEIGTGSEIDDERERPRDQRYHPKNKRAYQPGDILDERV